MITSNALSNETEKKIQKIDLSPALYIRERYEILDNNRELYTEEFQTKKILNQWITRKNVLNRKDYDDIININQFNEKEFAKTLVKDYSYINKKIFTKKFDWANLWVESLKRGTDLDYSPDMDYILIFDNLIAYAEEKISINLIDKFIGDKILDQFLGILYNKLVQICHKTVIYEINYYRVRELLEGSNSKERYFNYFKKFKEIGFKINFINKYPVLARLLAETAIDYTENICKFLLHYKIAYKEIFEKFDFSDGNYLENIEVDLGDTHQKGKTVFKLFFWDGKIIMYKPKNLKILQSYNDIVSWINLKTGVPNFKTYKIVLGEEFTFEEFIRQETCDNVTEVEEYFYNFGKLTALLYFLRGNDFHMENIIAAKNYPVAVDLETLLQQTNDTIEEEYFIVNETRKINKNSIIRTALFPIHGHQLKIDLSALSGNEQKIPYKIDYIKNEYSDKITYDTKEGNTKKANNNPSLSGIEVDYSKYVEEVLEGFEYIYRFFIEHKIELKRVITVFRNKITRVLFKNTMNYAQLLEISLHPNNLKDGLDREQIFENLWRSNLSNKQVIKSEIEDMLRQDIPIFFIKTDSKDIIDSKGRILKNYYKNSNYSLLENEIEILSYDNMEKQKSIIKLLTGKYSIAMDTPSKSIDLKEYMKTEVNIFTETEFLNISEKIGQFIIDKGIYDQEQELVVFESIVSKGENWSVGMPNASLYDGYAGMSLFFHYLFKMTKNDKYYEMEKYIDHTMYLLSKKKLNYSVISGENSYLSKWILTFDSNNVKLEEKISEEFMGIIENLEKISEIDWLNGLSSILRLALLMYEKTNKEKYILYSEKIAIYLIKTVDLSKIIGGFSHGASGIAYSIAELYQVTLKNDYLVFLKKIIDIDNSYFATSNNNWFTVKGVSENVNHWCHGSLGIGLSRILMKYKSKIELTKFDNDIVFANRNVINSSISKFETICHGNFGKVEFFIEQYKYTKEKKWLNLAKKLATMQLKQSYMNYGELPEINFFGLFTGLTGIGYELLRIIDNENVPSVLSFS